MDDSGTMKRADKDMAVVLAKLQELGAKPLGTQSVEDTRKGPTPADAVKALLKDQGKDPDALMAQMKVEKQDNHLLRANWRAARRVYKPEGATRAAPEVVFYHGGGWSLRTSTPTRHQPWLSPRRPMPLSCRSSTATPRAQVPGSPRGRDCRLFLGCSRTRNHLAVIPPELQWQASRQAAISQRTWHCSP
jgi:hypothetical protein